MHHWSGHDCMRSLGLDSTFNRLIVEVRSVTSMADSLLPTITDRIDLYLALWDTVGNEAFSVEQLRRGDLNHREGALANLADSDLRAHLETLVALGLLDWQGDDRYRIRLTPDDPLDAWLDRTAARTSELYEAVETAAEDRDAPESPTDDRDVIRFGGETYLRTTVSPEVTSEDVAAELTELLGQASEHDTAALCAPADQADQVQRIADRLCDDAAMADRPGPDCFEKVTTQVLGNDPDELEYRMYLARCDT